MDIYLAVEPLAIHISRCLWCLQRVFQCSYHNLYCMRVCFFQFQSTQRTHVLHFSLSSGSTSLSDHRGQSLNLEGKLLRAELKWSMEENFRIRQKFQITKGKGAVSGSEETHLKKYLRRKLQGIKGNTIMQCKTCRLKSNGAGARQPQR